ncbi:hypothetical protein FRB93_012101 [Tulasnella sp. JGI-2019a]|nr:hypothetical protein FRB93_012101 [Tulasnella sp. JGI-2019a]
MVWRRCRIFSDEAKLGLAPWLFNDERANTSTSVLFTYIPDWLMSSEDLKQPHLTPPTWFAGIHALGAEASTKHLVIYTGQRIVIGVFDPTFNSVSFTAPKPAGICKKVDALDSYEDTSGHLSQAISQIMLDAVYAPSLDLMPEPFTFMVPLIASLWFYPYLLGFTQKQLENKGDPMRYS